MGKYLIVIDKIPQKELQQHYKSGDKSSIRRIEQIFEELSDHPEAGIGKPEKLKSRLTGHWSRRINKKDRMIYRIDEQTDTVFVISAIGHYGDK